MTRDPNVERYVVPGRVNVIGEHTDYNDGLALPFATDLALSAVVSLSADDVVTVRSVEFGAWRSSGNATTLWMRQAEAIVRSSTRRGVTIDVESAIPAGAGLSSSAAYVVALAIALGHRDAPLQFAELVRDCEVAAGNNVGLLDPLAVLAARPGHALLIDFSSKSWEHVAIPSTIGFTVVHSGVTRALATSAYLERRAECAAARQLVRTWPPTMDEVSVVGDSTLRRRLRHVASENERVRRVVVALREGDLATVGSLIDDSHVSLRDDFEVSLPSIDELVSRLRAQRGVLGARLVGGGFGGCVLVVHDAARDVDPLGRAAWRVRPSDGALARLGTD